MKDVRQLSHAMFPGTHCPLMGAAMAVRGIQDAYMLLVGTDECTYYTKHITLYSQDLRGRGRTVPFRGAGRPERDLWLRGKDGGSL